MGADPDAIRQEIERSRAELGETVHELGERVGAGADRVHQAQERAQGAVDHVRDTTHRVAETVRGSSHQVAATVRGENRAGQQVRDVIEKVRQHPRELVLGSAVAGFVLGLLWAVAARSADTDIADSRR